MTESNLSEFALLIHETFVGCESGRKLLDYLIDNYLMQPTLPLEQDESFGRFREGQNDLVRTFLRGIKLYKQES